MGSALGRSLEKKMRLSNSGNLDNGESDSDDGVDLVGRHAGRVSLDFRGRNKSMSVFNAILSQIFDCYIHGRRGCMLGR